MGPKKTYIVLADDDHDDCLLFEDALSELPIHFELRVIHNGDQLMKLLHETPTNSLPDVLFLDLNMPCKSGLECMTEIKRNERFKDLSIVIFSTSLDKQIANRLYQDGVRFYIRKPTEFAQIKHVLLQAILFINKNGLIQPSRENFILTGDLTQSIV